MNKKFLSAILAVILAFSAAVIIPSKAAELKEENSAAKSGTFFFDSGDWNSNTVLFYIWDGTTYEYANNKGEWAGENRWGSRKWLSGTPIDEYEGVFESYEVDFSGRENHDIYVIFQDPDKGIQTFDSLVNSTVIGHTASRNGIIYENSVDSEKTAEGVTFDGGENVGAAKIITSSGRIQGDIIAPNADRADIVAKFILYYLYSFDDVSGEPVVTEESVADAISAFETNRDDVWEAYQSYSDEENYDEYAARSVIYSYNNGSPYDASSNASEGFSVIYDIEGIYGNIDGDQVITSSDALMILRASVSLEHLNVSKEVLADVDEDGIITSSDALEVLRVSVGLSTTSKAGSYCRTGRVS